MKHRLLNLLAGLSLLLCVTACTEEALRFSDDDFSFYWASNGAMISVDSFEDTPNGNAITMRRFSPMPSDIPFHFRFCSVEGGTDAPARGIGNSVAVWLDRKNQPVSSRDGGASTTMVNVSLLAQIPLNDVREFIFLTGFMPFLLVGVRYRARRQ